jgi:hypothetical protein
MDMHFLLLVSPSIQLLLLLLMSGLLILEHLIIWLRTKNPKHVLATGIADDITRLYKFDNFGSSSFSFVFVA